jgi:membrane fusion protein, heavy metal efflux system
MKMNVMLRIAPLLLAVLLCGSGATPPTDAHAGDNRGAAHAAAVEATGQCAAHGVARSLCFICDPALREPGRLWCKEHNRYEDRCWDCHPDARDKARLYCEEHGLYEDECFLCHPEMKRTQAAAAGAARLMCKEHGVPEDECGICHPELAGRLKPGQSVQVRLPSPESAALVGIETRLPAAGSISDGIECYAEFAFNQNKLAQIPAPVTGILREVAADLGDSVKEGQPVARIWSAAIAGSVAKAVLSHQNLAREKKLHDEGIASGKDLQEAEAEHRTACQEARTLGFSEEDIDAMGRRPDEQVLLAVLAPIAGEIIERNAVSGALVEAGKPLFAIADRATIWAMLNIPEAHLARVQTGQTVELAVDSLPGRTFMGTLTWIAAQVDERTRMARARAEVANPDGVLRDRMFARARIITRRAEKALLLPPSAIQDVDRTPLVFVHRADDLYEARAVRLGAKHNGQIEVVDGLKPDDQVVVRQAFSVKSQLLVSRLGAGCTDE